MTSKVAIVVVQYVTQKFFKIELPFLQKQLFAFRQRHIDTKFIFFQKPSISVQSVFMQKKHLDKCFADAVMSSSKIAK